MSMPRIKDVAKLARVSTTAVSLYLNDRPGISQETRERISSAITEIGYTPKITNRRPSKSGFIGVLVEKLPLLSYSDQFYTAVTQAMHDEADRLGYHLILGVVDPDREELPRLITEQQVEGIIAIGGGDITDDYLDQILDEGINLVAVDNYSNTRPIECVVTDNQGGGYAITRHLIEMGHRRIAMILGPTKYKPLNERFQGYLFAMHESGIGIDPALIQNYLSSGVMNKGYREMQQLLALDPLPTAVFAVSDRAAIGALEAIHERGLRVPEDISLVGFDGIAMGAHTSPPLTTVQSSLEAIGSLAVQRLHALINGSHTIPTKTVVYTNIILRESSAPPKAD